MKTIPNFPNYAISENGDVWNDKFYRFLKPYLNRYYRVSLCKKGKSYIKLIHRLVLETFVGPCPKGMQCRHLDGNSQNNHLSNLKWGTPSDNRQDAVKHGTHVDNSGEKNGNAKLTEQDVRMIIYMWKTNEFTQIEISNLYNICQQTVSDIVNKKVWKHIWKG